MEHDDNNVNTDLPSEKLNENLNPSDQPQGYENALEKAYKTVQKMDPIELAGLTALQLREKVLLQASSQPQKARNFFAKHGSYKGYISLRMEPKHLSIYGRYTRQKKMCKLDTQLLLGHSVLGFSSSRLRKTLESLKREWRTWKLPKFKRNSGPPLIAILLGHYVPVIISRLSRSIPDDTDEPWKYVHTIREFLMESLTDDDRRLFDCASQLDFWAEPRTDEFEKGSIIEFIVEMSNYCDVPPSSWKSSCRSYIDEVDQGNDTLPTYAATCSGIVRGIAGFDEPIFDVQLDQHQHRSFSEKILDGVRDNTCSSTLKLQYLLKFDGPDTGGNIYVGQILHEILRFESVRKLAEKTLKIRKRILGIPEPKVADVISTNTRLSANTGDRLIKDHKPLPSKEPQTVMAIRSVERPVSITRYLKLKIPSDYQVRAFRKFLRQQEGIVSSLELMRKSADYYTIRLKITGERRIVESFCTGNFWPLLEHGRIFSVPYEGDFNKPLKLEKNRLGGKLYITLNRIEQHLADLLEVESIEVPKNLVLHARYKLLTSIRSGGVLRPNFRRFIREVDATPSGILLKAKPNAFLPKEAVFDLHQLNEILKNVIHQFENWKSGKPTNSTDKCDFTVVPTTEWLLENTTPIDGSMIGRMPTSSDSQVPNTSQRICDEDPAELTPAARKPDLAHSQELVSIETERDDPCPLDA